MANWRFGAFPKLPYSTMQQLNLDWILDRIRRFLPDTGTKGQVLTRTKDGAAWVDPEAASGAVSSVNGKTGAVVLTASDVGALPSSYQAPVTSVNGMTGDVVISGGGAVDSVNGQTGEVVLTAADVGALPSSYQAPVSSVNGQTGAVQLAIPDSTSDLTNDSGFITAAQAAAAAPVQSVNGMTGAVMLGAPSSISLSIGDVYMKGLRAPGTGLSIELPLLRQPATVTGSDIAYYYNDMWNSVAVGGWYFSGSTLIIVFTNPPSAQGLYGMRGVINITY